MLHLMAEHLDFPHERLRFARKRKFRSMAAAAKAFKVGYSTYAGHENGNRDFRENAELYARRLAVNFEWLWTGKGPMDRSAPTLDIIADLPPDRQQAVLDFIEFQRSRP